MKKPLMLCILGPTASGKSGLAIEFAKKYNGEVISADSMQIYKEFNIGTAKILPEEMQGIAHHMLDIVEPYGNYSVADYCKNADYIAFFYSKYCIHSLHLPLIFLYIFLCISRLIIPGNYRLFLGKAFF